MVTKKPKVVVQIIYGALYGMHSCKVRQIRRNSNQKEIINNYLLLFIINYFTKIIYGALYDMHSCKVGQIRRNSVQIYTQNLIPVSK